MVILGLILGSIIVILAPTLWEFILSITWKPYSTAQRLRKQGITGPKTKFWSGNLDEIVSMKKEAWNIELDINSHDIVPKILPHYSKWINQYAGGTFVYWFGWSPRVVITDAEHVKQILSKKFGFFRKPKFNEHIIGLLGRKGLLITEGSEWVRHRRVVSPAFTTDKLKLMTKEMAECTRSMLDTWHNKVTQADEEHNWIEVNQQFLELSADVLTHAAFGSSYLEGKEVFEAQKELQNIILPSLTSVRMQIPGYKYLPTKENRRRWMLDRKVTNILENIINKRMKLKNSDYGKDLLGLMMESTEKEGLKINDIIDECKTFYFAGQETTSQLLTWTMYLLGTNQDWQERLRHEVLNICGTETPTADNLTKFNFVTMVLLETLRLYGPVFTISRVALEDIELEGFDIPKGTMVGMPIAILHRKKELWGEDANKFNPLRFENGATKAATHPNALFAFSIGPRSCPGQNFAMIEAKMILAMILQRFSFTVSECYRHTPAEGMTLQLQYGLPIVFKPLVC